MDKPSTSQSHSNGNGNGNGSAAYGGGAYADGNKTNGASHADGPVILNGQVHSFISFAKGTGLWPAMLSHPPDLILRTLLLRRSFTTSPRRSSSS